MLRLTLAAMLLGAVCVVDAFSGKLPTTPISVELAIGNPVVVAIFVLLGVLLVYFARHCWRIRWKALSVVATTLILMVPAIAFTNPTTRIHTIIFAVFVVLGIIWLIAYAEADCQRSISVLTILLVLAAGPITVILGVVSSGGGDFFVHYWPVGMFQRGFLIAFGLLALRQPNQLAEQVAGGQAGASPSLIAGGSQSSEVAGPLPPL